MKKARELWCCYCRKDISAKFDQKANRLVAPERTVVTIQRHSGNNRVFPFCSEHAALFEVGMDIVFEDNFAPHHTISLRHKPSNPRASPKEVIAFLRARIQLLEGYGSARIAVPIG